ncbi:ABC transporter substrate-binding protein [Marinithermofilum abyssi]|uniref:ABC transporter substrate-binding protein n=1 Tax=Marinithermofilum abyssi TaxID=1571185 RepID=A0A8J2VF81_9BACL|nr:metal ABC transporter substrate-binding protein [Marinithermofilum abyssi]GGE06316.1 ABC transporter substrate-binding protein [Marinithermofilum abyssi]
MKRITYGWMAVLILILAAAAGCSDIQTKNNEKLQVYTSMYPLADFAEKIGGKHVQVTNMVPSGVEPHEFEPKPRDMMQLQNADVFIYNGAGFESWAEKAQSALGEHALTVNSTKSIDLKASESHHREDGHDHGGVNPHDQEDGHDHGGVDPHVWLDPVLAKKQAAAIRDALVKKDPQHRKEYEANYQKLAQRLDTLDQQLKKITKQAKRKEIIVSHAAYGHLAERYDLKQIAISGLSPSQEPTAKDLKRVVEEARKHRVKYIFFETLVHPKVEKSVQEEIGARALTLNPLEGLTKDQESRGEDYFSIMEQNAKNLAIALGVRS